MATLGKEKYTTHDAGCFQVNFNAGSQSLGRNSTGAAGGLENRRGSRSQLSFSRKFPFVKSTEKLNEFTDNERKCNKSSESRPQPLKF